MTKALKEYIVQYTTLENFFDSKRDEFFRCQAEDISHAEEQCLDAYPDVIVTAVRLIRD